MLNKFQNGFTPLLIKNIFLKCTDSLIPKIVQTIDRSIFGPVQLPFRKWVKTWQRKLEGGKKGKYDH